MTAHYILKARWTKAVFLLVSFCSAFKQIHDVIKTQLVIKLLRQVGVVFRQK